MFIGDIYNAPVVPITKGINPPNAKGLSSLTRPIIPSNPISFNIQQKGSTFNDLLKEVKPSGLEYLIPQSQALRFDEQSWNPYYNIEDIYSKNKSWYRNIGVGTLKAVPAAVESFLDTFASVAGPGETSQEIHHEASRALRTLEEEFPQYWTKAYQDNPSLLNTLQGNFSGFIGDKLIKNLGFTVGALAGGVVTDLVLTPIASATAGAVLPTMAVATGKSLKNAYRGISNIFKSAAKGASADDIVNLTRVTRDINRTASTLNASQKLITGAKFGLSSWMAAAGEASVEALGAKDEYEKLVSEQFRVSNGREPDEFERKLFQENGKALANSTFTWNLPILLASNAIQFGSILYGKSLLRSFGRPVRWNGKEFVTSSLTGKIGKEIIVDGLTEGAQEGLQSVISKGTTSKYVEQSLLGKQASNLLIDYKKGLEVLGEQEGKESVLVGALTGILTAGFGTVLSRVSPSKFKGLYTDHKEAKQVAATLNQQRDQFDSFVKGLVHAKRSNQALEKGDILNYIDEKHQELFEQVSFFKDYDLWEDRLNELGNLKLEDFNNLTKLNLNEGERQSYVSSLISESREIKKAIENVDKIAPRVQFNLPRKSRVLAKIKEDNPNLTDKEAEEQAIEVVKAAYEDSRKELAKKLSLLNNRAKRAERLKSELSEFVNENILDTILVSGTKGLKKDLLTRKEQLESLLSRENLSQPAQLYNAEFKRELKEIEEKIQIIESSDNEVDKESKIFKLQSKLLPLNFVRDFQDLKRLSKLQGIEQDIEILQNPIQAAEQAEEEVIQAEQAAVQADEISQKETQELQEYDRLGDEEKINKAYEIVSKLKNGDDLTESEELLYKAYGDEFDRIYEEKQDEALSLFEEVKPEDSLEIKKSKRADIERRRQEELDNLFSETQASTDKQLNTPVQKLSKEEVSKNIETAKQQNKDLIEELENPEFLNDEKRNDEWDKKADELSDKLPQGVSFRITDGKVDFFDSQSYREKGFGKSIVPVSVFTLHNQTEKFEVGDNIQVQDGARAIPAIVTKVNEHGKILEAKQEDGKITISRGNIITLAPGNDRLKINAKYDAELKALEERFQKVAKGTSKTNTKEQQKADIERRRQEELERRTASSFPIRKYDPEGDNYILEGDELEFTENRIERLIEKGIAQGKSAEEIHRSVSSDLAFSLGAEITTIKNFIEDRIAGKTKQTFAEFRKDTRKEINAKYDAELAKLESKKSPESSKGIIKSVRILKNYVNKEVLFKGRKGVLRFYPESFKYEIETNNVIYELSDVTEDSLIEDLSIEEVKTEDFITEEPYQKYNIVINSESSVTVNNVVYNILLTDNGNVSALVPLNKKNQKLKNEQLIIAVEIERNKRLIPRIKEQKAKIIKQKPEKSINITNVVNNLIAIGYNSSIDKSIDDLIESRSLTRGKLKRLTIWVYSKYERLEKLKEEYSDTYLQKTYDNISYLKSLLEKTKKENKYDITNLTEDAVYINNVKYDIEVDGKGNIISLINKTTRLTNEKILIEVEIERNKIAYTNISRIEDVTKNNIHSEALSENKSAFVLNQIWTENFTDIVDQALDLLYQDLSLNETQSLQLDLWLTETIYKTEKELEKNSNDSVLFSGWEVLLLIQELLYKQKENENKSIAKPVIVSTAKSKNKRSKKNRTGSKSNKEDKTQIVSLLEQSSLVLEEDLLSKDFSFVRIEIENLLKKAEKLKNTQEEVFSILEGVNFLITEYRDKTNLDDLIEVKNLLENTLKESDADYTVEENESLSPFNEEFALSGITESKKSPELEVLEIKEETTGDKIDKKRKELDEKAKKLGYPNIRQLNTQSVVNDNSSVEERFLLDEYSKLLLQIWSLNNESDIISLSEQDFGIWVKANDVQRNELNQVLVENELPLAFKRVSVLFKRGDLKQANIEKSNLELSRKKSDWTIDSYEQRHGDRLSQHVIENINNEGRTFNQILDKGLQDLKERKNSNKPEELIFNLEKFIQENNLTPEQSKLLNNLIDNQTVEIVC